MSPAQEISQELPKITMEFRIVRKGASDIVYTYEGDMPQEIQDQYAGLVGNGLARISLGIPMDLKNYGSGPGAHVSLSLTCNQDAQTIHRAYQLATEAVIYYVKQNLGRALAEFDQVVAQREAQLGNAPSPNPPRFG